MKPLYSLLVFLALALPVEVRALDYAGRIVPLIAPAKLATLGERGANQRFQKCIYWLDQSRAAGENPTNTARVAVWRAGYRGAAAVLTEQSLLRSLNSATQLGCLDSVGLAKMRRGGAPTVRRGPYAGDIASVDHIIPRAVIPELDCVIANLELLPLKLNQRKNSSIGARQRDLARKLHHAGLLSDAGLVAVNLKR